METQKMYLVEESWDTGERAPYAKKIIGSFMSDENANAFCDKMKHSPRRKKTYRNGWSLCYYQVLEVEYMPDADTLIKEYKRERRNSTG